MARIRAIHPDFPSDKKLATVCRDARLTYALTWCIADDAGLFRANPRQLLGQLYPYDVDVTEDQLEGWLVALVGLGVLRWHISKDGARVGEIVNWPKRQKIDRPSKSFLSMEIGGLARVERASSEPLTEGSDGIRETLARPSLLESLSPESRVLSPESVSPESVAALRARLPATAHEALDGYVRAAHFPKAVIQTVLAEGPDTGTNGTAGKTWEMIGQALVDMRAASKPFTPLVLRAFIRKLLEVPPAPKGTSEAERMTQMGLEEQRRERAGRP